MIASGGPGALRPTGAGVGDSAKSFCARWRSALPGPCRHLASAATPLVCPGPRRSRPNPLSDRPWLVIGRPGEGVGRRDGRCLAGTPAAQGDTPPEARGPAHGGDISAPRADPKPPTGCRHPAGVPRAASVSANGLRDKAWEVAGRSGGRTDVPGGGGARRGGGRGLAERLRPKRSRSPAAYGFGAEGRRTTAVWRPNPAIGAPSPCGRSPAAGTGVRPAEPRCRVLPIIIVRVDRASVRPAVDMGPHPGGQALCRRGSGARARPRGVGSLRSHPAGTRGAGSGTIPPGFSSARSGPEQSCPRPPGRSAPRNCTHWQNGALVLLTATADVTHSGAAVPAGIRGGVERQAAPSRVALVTETWCGR